MMKASLFSLVWKSPVGLLSERIAVKRIVEFINARTQFKKKNDEGTPELSFLKALFQIFLIKWYESTSIQKNCVEYHIDQLLDSQEKIHCI